MVIIMEMVLLELLIQVVAVVVLTIIVGKEQVELVALE